METIEQQQKTTKFEPNTEQLVFANFYIQSHGSIRESFELMGRDRGIYYENWRHQEGFELWLQEYSKSEVMKRIGKWYLLLEKYAEKGSFQHLDRLLQIAKEFLPVENNPNINIFPNKTIVFRDIGPSDTENLNTERNN